MTATDAAADGCAALALALALALQDDPPPVTSEG